MKAARSRSCWAIRAVATAGLILRGVRRSGGGASRDFIALAYPAHAGASSISSTPTRPPSAGLLAGPGPCGRDLLSYGHLSTPPAWRWASASVGVANLGSLRLSRGAHRGPEILLADWDARIRANAVTDIFPVDPPPGARDQIHHHGLGAATLPERLIDRGGPADLVALVIARLLQHHPCRRRCGGATCLAAEVHRRKAAPTVMFREILPTGIAGLSSPITGMNGPLDSAFVSLISHSSLVVPASGLQGTDAGTLGSNGLRGSATVAGQLVAAVSALALHPSIAASGFNLIGDHVLRGCAPARTCERYHSNPRT